MYFIQDERISIVHNLINTEHMNVAQVIANKQGKLKTAVARLLNGETRFFDSSYAENFAY